MRNEFYLKFFRLRINGDYDNVRSGSIHKKTSVAYMKKRPILSGVLMVLLASIATARDDMFSLPEIDALKPQLGIEWSEENQHLIYHGRTSIRPWETPDWSRNIEYILAMAILESPLSLILHYPAISVRKKFAVLDSELEDIADKCKQKYHLP